MSYRAAILVRRYYMSFLCGVGAGVSCATPWWWLAFVAAFIGEALVVCWDKDERHRSKYLAHVLGVSEIDGEQL